MFRKMLNAVVTLGFLLAVGILVAPAQAGTHSQHCKTHHCWGWHKHHAHHHHKHWHHYNSHKKFRADPDFNHHPEYGWGYYNDPASNWVKPAKYHHVANHCHSKKSWRHGKLVRVTWCHSRAR